MWAWKLVVLLADMSADRLVA
jgi:hypothetical protein